MLRVELLTVTVVRDPQVRPEGKSSTPLSEVRALLIYRLARDVTPTLF